MSPKNSLLNAGLTALGLFVLAPASADEPVPAPASGPETAAAPAPSHMVLLLTNGRLHEGMFSDGGSVYLWHAKGGTIPIEKRHVETTGRTMLEIYQYKLSRLPERDPDEQMKLARWCLVQRLPEEAKTHLQAMLKLSPHNREAQSVLASIMKSEARERQRDDAINQAGAEVVAGQPEPLDPAILGRARHAMGISPLPQIADLPAALATRRADEFAFYVEPILQSSCVKCHNENTEGTFRLVWYKSKRDRTVDARRANLDAVLRFVDMENPIKSVLLSSTLRNHGNGNNPQPVFQGSNDVRYQVLAKWVTSLRPNRTSPVAQAAQPALREQNGRFTAPEGAEAVGFAVQRGNQAVVPAAVAPTSTSPYGGSPYAQPPPPREVVPLPAGQYIPGGASAGQQYAPPGTEFPAPYLVGGPRPKMPSAQPAIPPPIPAGSQPPGASIPPPQLPPSAVSAATAGEVVGPDKSKPKKSVPVDPALLEKALMNRYQPQ